jgi:drug/metabolite transporter (DMT)-like permease
VIVGQKESLWLGFGLAAGGTLLFSFKSIFIKLLYQQGLQADAVLVLRMLIALPLYLVILTFSLKKLDGRAALTKSILSLTLMAGFLGYYLASLLDLMGLELITAQLERLTLFSYPLLVALIGVIFLKEKLRMKLVFALAVSYFGLALVMSQEELLSGSDVGLGVGLVLTSALAFAIYLSMSKPLIGRLGSVLFTSLAMSVSSLLVFSHGFVTLEWVDLTVTSTAWFWLVLLAIFSTVIPSFMISAAISRIGAIQASAVGMLGPVFTIALAIYFLDEPFTLMIAIGALLVLMGVGSLQFKR